MAVLVGLGAAQIPHPAEREEEPVTQSASYLASHRVWCVWWGLLLLDQALRGAGVEGVLVQGRQHTTHNTMHEHARTAGEHAQLQRGDLTDSKS